MDNTALLRKIGEALYGSRWQTDLANALEVSDRTVRYWLGGDEIPGRIWGDLRALAASRKKEIDAIIARLPEPETKKEPARP